MRPHGRRCMNLEYSTVLLSSLGFGWGDDLMGHVPVANATTGKKGVRSERLIWRKCHWE